MLISNINNKPTNPIKKLLSNPKAAGFARTTAYAISVETTLKALGRPCFIYFDDNANKRSKKYAASKEFIYQTFCLGLYLSLIKSFKGKAYKIIRKQLVINNKEAEKKLDLYDNFQAKINAEKNKIKKKNLEKDFVEVISNNKDYHLGKGARELGAILSTVVILGICAPLSAQVILHPAMDLIFKKKSKQINAKQVK